MRLIFKVLIGLLVVAVLVGGYVIYNVTSIAETRMTETLRTPVNIGRVELWWNSVAVRSMEITNIDGSELQPAFSCRTIKVDADPQQLMEPAARVRQVLIEGPTLKVELYDRQGKDTNWSRMLEHLKAKEQAQADETDKQDFVLEHLLVTDITVVAVGGPLGDEPVEVIVPKIEEHNLTSESQLPIEAIVSAVTSAVIQRTITRALPDLLEKSSEILKAPVEGTKGVLEKVVPGADKILPGASEGDGASKSIFKNPFKRD